MNDVLWWFGQNSLATLLMIPCVMLACRLFRDSPAVQHLLWLVILLKFVTPPIVAWPWSVDELRSMAWSQDSVVQVATLERSSAASNVEIIQPSPLPMEAPFAPIELIPNSEPIKPLALEPAVADVVPEKLQPTTLLHWSRIIGFTLLSVWFIGAFVCLVSQIRRLTRYARLVRCGGGILCSGSSGNDFAKPLKCPAMRWRLLPIQTTVATTLNYS